MSIPNVQDWLKDRFPRGEKLLNSLVSNILSDKPRTSSVQSAYLEDSYHKLYVEKSRTMVHYRLGNSFSGAASREVK